MIFYQLEVFELPTVGVVRRRKLTNLIREAGGLRYTNDCLAHTAARQISKCPFVESVSVVKVSNIPEAVYQKGKKL